MLKSSLQALAERIEEVRSDHDKLESENKLLQAYIDRLTRMTFASRATQDQNPRINGSTGTTTSSKRSVHTRVSTDPHSK
jgi:hypothetical protein